MKSNNPLKKIKERWDNGINKNNNAYGEFCNSIDNVDSLNDITDKYTKNIQNLNKNIENIEERINNVQEDLKITKKFYTEVLNRGESITMRIENYNQNVIETINRRIGDLNNIQNERLAIAARHWIIESITTFITNHPFLALVGVIGIGVLLKFFWNKFFTKLNKLNTIELSKIEKIVKETIESQTKFNNEEIKKIIKKSNENSQNNKSIVLIIIGWILGKIKWK